MGFTHLTSPLKMGDLQLKNRIVLGSMTRNRNVVPQKVNQDYYRQRANAGLVLTEGTLVSEQGTQWPEAPGIYTAEQVAGWKEVVDVVHEAGSYIFMQLWHVGRVTHPGMPLSHGQPPLGPSAIAARGGHFRDVDGEPGYVTPKAIPDPSVIVEEFRSAAVNAKKAGFDGIELHSANGYLVDQFLNNGANQRTDKYGGSVENRMRFPLEILDALITVFPAHRIGIKIGPAGGYNDVGPLGEDGKVSEKAVLEQFQPYVKQLDSRGLAYIQIMRAGFGNPEFDGVKRGLDELDILKHFRPLVKRAKLFLNVGLSPEDAEKEIASGNADAVTFSRAYISNPDFAQRIVKGVELDQKSLNFQDMATWYAYPDNKKETGYTDYPSVSA